MGIDEALVGKREKVLRLCARYGARNLRVFGSVARGGADEESDIDFVVEFESGRSLLDHAAVWLELQDLLGCKADVVSDRGIKARIRIGCSKKAVLLSQTRRSGCGHPGCHRVRPASRTPMRLRSERTSRRCYGAWRYRRGIHSLRWWLAVRRAEAGWRGRPGAWVSRVRTLKRLVGKRRRPDRDPSCY